MTMENQPLEDGSPIKNWVIFSIDHVSFGGYTYIKHDFFNAFFENSCVHEEFWYNRILESTFTFKDILQNRATHYFGHSNSWMESRCVNTTPPGAFCGLGCHP